MKIAIVGFGPRGLACLENLILEVCALTKKTKIEVLIFETSKNLGTGKAWQLEQPETNYINISDHALQSLKGREKMVLGTSEIPSFPGYTQWCLDNNKKENIGQDKDAYPPRFQMGAYLNGRALSICNELETAGILKIYKQGVTSVSYADSIVSVNTSTSTFKVQECLLTLGHIPINDSDETKKFKKHAAKNNVLYIHNPYEKLIARDDLANKTVAIKGFGLSMLDITRQLTSYKYGEFKKKKNSRYLKFEAAKGCVKKIVPYSYDGLPCVPKPYGRKVDQTFEPDTTQKNTFELSLRNALAQPENLKNINFFLEAVSELTATIFNSLNKTTNSHTQIKELVLQWLQDPEFAHPLILDITLPAIRYMEETVEMAWGTKKATLDFVVGQVWRHLHPTMYRVFAFSSLPHTTMQQLVEIDQALKRYTFGPPVKSILELIALHEAGILELTFVDDPDVRTVPDGWKITKNTDNIVADMLCNSVMDSPILEKMDSTIFERLLENNMLQAVCEELGVLTHPDGTVVSPENPEKTIPISVLGRNAKGSILGTDAVLECFSPETHDWARGVMARQV